MADRTEEDAKKNGGGDGPFSGLLDQLPTEQLAEQGQKMLTALVERLVDTASEKAGDLTEKLTDYAENGGPGLKAALSGGKAMAEGKSPMRAAMSAGMSGIGEKVKSAFGGGGGGGSGGKQLKVTNIVEEIDIGVPVRLAYNQWTQFGDFPDLMKKVESVNQESDEKINWKAQVFWSHRTWESTIIEQIPDDRIVWKSSGPKGHVDGAVSFHELTPNLTRMLFVLEYYPKGLFEKTGNIWRAVGRRARLEIKYFRRHVMTQTMEDLEAAEGWRGEIRDSEVVKSHEDAMEEEEQEQERDEDTGEESGEQESGEYEDDEGEYDDEESDEDEDDEEESDEDEDDGYDEEGDYEDDEEDDDEEDDDEEEAPEEDPARPRRRATAGRR